MKEYIIPIGIDGEKLINPLSKAIDKMEQVSSTARESGKVIEQAFTDGAKGATIIDEKIKPITKSLDAIKVLGKQAGKEMADAFSDRNIDPSKFEKAIAGFKSKLASLSEGVQINLSDDQLKVVERQLANTTNEFEELGVAVNYAKTILDTLDPNSEEFAKMAEGIAFVESSLEGFGEEIAKTTGKNKTLKQELRSIKEELAQLELAGESGGERFKQLQMRAGALTDQIGDTNAQIKALASDTGKFDGLISGVQGLTGGFVAVQGATALFGDESEDLQKALLKVNGAMAVLQGLQAVSETLNKDSAFSVIFLSKARSADAVATGVQTTALGAQTVATRTASLASKGLGLALKAIGIGLIITAIAYLIEYWDDLKDALNKVLPAGQSVGKMFDKIKSIAFGVGNALVQYVLAPIKAIYYATQGEFGKALDAMKSGYDVIGNFRSEKNKQDLRNIDKYNDEKTQKAIDDEKRDLERRKNRGEKTYDLEKKNIEKQLALNKKNGIKNEDLQKEYEDLTDKHYKELADKRTADRKKSAEDAKKRAEDARKKAEEERKAREEEAKKNNDLVKKFAEEKSRIELEAMDDGLAKTLKAIDLETKSKVDALKAEEATSKKAIEDRNALILVVEEDGRRRKAVEERKYNDEVIKLRLDGLKALADLQTDSTERDLKLLQIDNDAKIADIKEKYKNETDLRDELLTAQGNYLIERQNEVIKKGALKELSDEEEKLILLAELTAGYTGKSEKVEEQKQLAIMQIKADFAQKNLDLLLSSGADENSLEVLKARKLVADTRKAVEDAIKDGKSFDFFEFIGLDINNDQKKAVMDAGAEMLNAVGAITDGLIENYQQQIDKKQEVIDQIDNEIGDLESRLEEEKELKDAGFANDYELIQAELDAKKAQRAEELRQQEEMVKKQNEIKKAQFAIDTAIQLSGLITSSVEIFKSLAGIPFIGIPLAIATIGTMFGAFAIAKTNAYNAIGSGQKFRTGGDINGSSHESGGVKYYSADGQNIELEGGEFVVRKDKRSKYRGLLDAMNGGDFNGLTLSDVGVRALFSDLGINLRTESIGETLDNSRSINNLRNGAKNGVNFSGHSFRRMDDNIDYLAQRKRDEAEVWEDANYYYTRIGTKTTKRKKN